MFEQLMNLLGGPTSGTFVSIFIGILSYVRERKQSQKRATIDDYLEWLRRRNHEELLEGESQILAKLETGTTESQVAHDCLCRLIGLVEEQSDRLSEIAAQTSLLPSMDEKLNLLLETFPSLESGKLLEGQVTICAKVLDVLAEGLKGAGVRATLAHKPDCCKAGTMFCVWLLGDKSPGMMLMDYVGGIRDNRISLVLNSNGSLAVRVYDGVGRETVIHSPAYEPNDLLAALAVWKDRELSFWVNGLKHGSATLHSEFKFLGPLLLSGLDIEGKLSADAVRWAPPGEQTGLHFQKDGIWHGSRMDLMLLWGRDLTKEEIESLAQDPYAMFRPRECVDYKCPDCGGSVRVDHERKDKASDALMPIRLDEGTEQEPANLPGPRYPNVWCVCSKCGKPCLNRTGFPPMP